jgi:tellurite resistance protein TerC
MDFSIFAGIFQKLDLSIIAIIVQLIFLEGILSIDNAAVLGAMVTPLSDKEEIPWPTALKPLGIVLNKMLGKQRGGALRVGLLGAYLGRGLMLLAASFIIQNPWLKLVGALYLIRLALEDLSASEFGEGDEGGNAVKVRSFWMTVLSVELMDLAFSLDNVVAAVSLSHTLWIVITGVFIGILVMRFAAGIFSYVVEKEPILKTAAYILVLNIGVELMIEEFPLDKLAHPVVLSSFMQHLVSVEANRIAIGDWTRFGISMLTIALTLAYAHIKPLRILRPGLVWISQGFALVNGTITWLLAPVKGIFNLIVRIIRAIFKPRQPVKIAE